MAENRGWRALARLVLMVRRQGNVSISFGSKTMAKLESFTFMLGMMLSGLLLVVTISPIA
ncbi:MAG TPA: hypothetical protein VEW25_07750 [Allosphingosinicella sp.]|nr:hypothetical protein [Allosphingosinicella sp.]